MTRKSPLLAALGLVACVTSYQSMTPIADGLKVYDDIRAVQEFREAKTSTDSLYRRIRDGGVMPRNVIQTIHENPQLMDGYFEALARRDSLKETPQVREPLEDKQAAGNNLLYILFTGIMGLASIFVGLEKKEKFW